MMLIVQNDVNIRNISVKKINRKLLNIIAASFPMLKYSVPTSTAMQVWMIKRIRASDRSRRKQRIFRIVNKYHWRQNDVAYAPFGPEQHFRLFILFKSIFGFFHRDDTTATVVGSTGIKIGASSGANTGVTKPPSIILAGKIHEKFIRLMTNASMFWSSKSKCNFNLTKPCFNLKHCFLFVFKPCHVWICTILFLYFFFSNSFCCENNAEIFLPAISNE